MAIGINQLDPYFQNLIANIMDVERQPLTRVTQTREALNVQRGAYLDANNRLKSLQSSVKALSVSLTSTAFTPGRTASITNAPSNTTVVSASASSSAVTGTYDLAVSKLARAQRRVSTVQSSVDLALGKTGEFWLGGTGSAGTTMTGNGTVTTAGTGSVASGQKELGTGDYTVETREVYGTKQFRLKDSDGNVVTIANSNGDFTGDWQNLTAGTLDTKRGLTLSFTGDNPDTTTALTYTAAGTKVDIAATDSLQSIVTKINDTVQTEGREISASIVGKQLVLSATRTGTNHTMIYSDNLSGGGLGFTGVDLQAAQNAEFTVNNLSFTRSINSGITDVVNGVSLNLAADAEGKSATINVTADTTDARQGITNFLNEFNTTLSYLKQQTDVVVTNSGDTTTYTRGALSTDNIFSDLRSDLFSVFTSDYSTSSLYTSLRDIGLSIDDNLQAKITDSTKLDAALGANLSQTQSLFDKIMGDLNTKLGQFTGTSNGYISNTLNNLDSEIASAGTDIKEWNSRLDAREEFYYQQYGELQAQLLLLSSTKRSLSASG